jgi:hypothetical protein
MSTHFSTTTEINRVYHDFCKRFQNGQDLGAPPKYHLRGWKLIEAVEKWAQNNKDRVNIIRTNDRLFSSSILVLIDNVDKSHFHGTTVIHIPQCAEEQPHEFFMYMYTREALAKVLSKDYSDRIIL